MGVCACVYTCTCVRCIRENCVTVSGTEVNCVLVTTSLLFCKCLEPEMFVLHIACTACKYQ